MSVEPELLLSQYKGQGPLDDGFVSELKDALFEPESRNLRELLAKVRALGKWDLTLVEEGQQLIKRGREEERYLFVSEATERAAVASSLVSRLPEQSEHRKELFIVWQACERSLAYFGNFEPGFSPEQMDRLLRARTLATENISASNSVGSIWKYLKPAFVVPEHLGRDAERAALFRTLVSRLEQAETETRQNRTRREAAFGLPRSQRGAALEAARRQDCFFKEDDYGILDALRRAVGSTGESEALARHAADVTERESQRAALLASLSPVWRDLFEWLLDLRCNERQIHELHDTPQLQALSDFSDEDRGVILSELALLRTSYAEIRSLSPKGRLDGLARVRAGMGIDFAGFQAWQKLKVVGALLVQNAATLADAEMAEVLAAAQKWRPLCDVGLLDSAERTLQREPAPLTLQALAALTKRPSHCIVPGNAGQEYEGDRWWNYAPSRARCLINRYGRSESRRSGGPLGRIFGF